MAGGGSTDWGGILLGVAGLGALYLGYQAYQSGALNNLFRPMSPPMMGGNINPMTGQPMGYCMDGSTPNPSTGLCANGTAPTTVPIAQNPYQQPQIGAGACTGQDSYTGQPCACIPPMTSSAMMMYGQMSQQYQPSTPTCNCTMCGQTGGYGQQSPYGSPYGQSPYGTSPYGSPPGYGIGGIGQGLYPPGYPSYPYGPIGANYSPYPAYPSSPISLGGYPGYPGVSPIISPIAVPYGGFGAGLPGLPGFGGGGGGGGGSAFGGGGGGFGGRGGRGGFQGTADLNGYAGASIARDAYGF